MSPLRKLKRLRKRTAVVAGTGMLAMSLVAGVLPAHAVDKVSGGDIPEIVTEPIDVTDDMITEMDIRLAKLPDIEDIKADATDKLYQQARKEFLELRVILARWSVEDKEKLNEKSFKNYIAIQVLIYDREPELVPGYKPEGGGSEKEDSETGFDIDQATDEELEKKLAGMTDEELEQFSENLTDEQKARISKLKDKKNDPNNPIGDTTKANKMLTYPTADTIGSNLELISRQTILKVPVIESDNMHFVKIDAEEVLFAKDAFLYEEESTKSRVVGVARRNNLGYVMRMEKNGWYYIESGLARGFVQAEDLITGDSALAMIARYELQLEHLNYSVHGSASASNKTYSLLSDGTLSESEPAVRNANTAVNMPLSVAVPTVLSADNKAYTYTLTTARNCLIEKTYLIAAEDAEIMEERPSLRSPVSETEDTPVVVGTLPRNALTFLISDEGDGWYYIESGDVRGFVDASLMIDAKTSALLVSSRGEDQYELAKATLDPSANRSFYYAIASTEEGDATTAIRQAMVNYAAQFVGNPYVWGGTDPVYGADCSGFVQTIYSMFGYSIPRTSAEQSQYGKKVDWSSIEPGDLLFYASSGRVHHVAMYAGLSSDGVPMTVEAYGTGVGIVYKEASRDGFVWATKLIWPEDAKGIADYLTGADTVVIDTLAGYGDSDTYIGENIGLTDAQDPEYGEYLGRMRITAYCACTQCCGKWANGITASGTTVCEGRTIAAGPGIPLGTKLIVGGQVYTVEDRGSGIADGCIDIYMNDHDRCNEFGVQYADVYVYNGD